jgi:hypothetical protein
LGTSATSIKKQNLQFHIGIMDYKTSIEDCKMDYKTSTEYNFINESRAAMNTQNLNTRKYIEWRRD